MISICTGLSISSQPSLTNFFTSFTSWRNPFFLGGSFLSQNPDCKHASQRAFKIKLSIFFSLEVCISMAVFWTCPPGFEDDSLHQAPLISNPQAFPWMSCRLLSDKSFLNHRVLGLPLEAWFYSLAHVRHLIICWMNEWMMWHDMTMYFFPGMAYNLRQLVGSRLRSMNTLTLRSFIES